jgi:hypothetical protein
VLTDEVPVGSGFDDKGAALDVVGCAVAEMDVGLSVDGWNEQGKSEEERRNAEEGARRMRYAAQYRSNHEDWGLWVEQEPPLVKTKALGRKEPRISLVGAVVKRELISPATVSARTAAVSSSYTSPLHRTHMADSKPSQ